jgi:uncharacterized protein YndB with AHSA1/START domain
MSRGNDDTVHLEIEIDVPPERAFQVFTQRFDRIKVRHHNLMTVDIAETVVEPWEGGRLYDRGADGQLCQWGRVLAVDAPHRLVFSWDISPRWQLEPDPARCSEVEVTFAALDGGRTRVQLEHRHLDRHGEGWEGERDAVAGDDGWPIYLAQYRDLVAGG